MDFKLCTKNAQGKWWTYGSIKKNQWDNNQASFKISALEELIGLAKSKNTEWVNLSLFENDKDRQPKQAQPIAQHEAVIEELMDEVPF